MTLHIAAVGDSHTASGIWPVVLEGLICRQGISAEVWDYGINGGIVAPAVEAVLGGSYMDDFFQEPVGSKWISSELERCFYGYIDACDVSMIVLQGGANDLGYLTRNYTGQVERAAAYMRELEGKPLFHEIPEKLEMMLSAINERGYSAVYMNMPPLGRGRWSDECARAVGNLARGLLNERLKGFCARERILYVDVASALAGSDGWLSDEYNGDGLHLNQRGQVKVAQVVFEVLKPSLAPFLAAGETGCHSIG